MKIKHVDITRLDRSIWGHLGDREMHLPLSNPMAIYPRYRSMHSWFWDQAITVVTIENEDGAKGIGWTEDGTGAAEAIIRNHLIRFLINENPYEVEGIWERLFRASIPYGRKGAALEAISAIDIALWDLLGHAQGRSVCELLGGPKTPTVPAYASALHQVEADKVVREAREYVAQGFTAMKLRFGNGPADGDAGMAENEEHVRIVRDAIGDDIMLMADAYMGWNLYYAQRMCDRLGKYNLAWLEEPLIPDDLRGYARLRQTSPVPIAGGEHEFTRYGFQQIIEMEAMDVLQPDVHRCGGFTEGKKIAAMASAAGLPVYPHAYTTPHVHFVGATINCPMVEFYSIPVWESSDAELPTLMIGEPQPVNGSVTIPTAPGLGITLSEALVRELAK